MSSRWQLPGLLFWYPIFESSGCNSFEDRAPVDQIYGCPIFKWVAKLCLHDRVPGPKQWPQGDLPYSYSVVVTTWLSFNNIQCLDIKMSQYTAMVIYRPCFIECEPRLYQHWDYTRVYIARSISLCVTQVDLELIVGVIRSTLTFITQYGGHRKCLPLGSKITKICWNVKRDYTKPNVLNNSNHTQQGKFLA